jgi:predicted RNA-binding Zn ribbon-like protein
MTAMTPTEPTSRFSRLSGHAVLDLFNTVDWRLDPSRRIERLRGMEDVVDWCLVTELLDAGEHAALVAAAGEHPRTAAREHAANLAWRELAYDAVVEGSERAMRKVVEEYRAVLARTDLLPSEATREWAWGDAHLSLATPRDRIVRATVDLATRPDLGLIHQCEDDACGWVYLDTSPRHNRRWCSAAGCGNRNRARRFYEKRRTAE